MCWYFFWEIRVFKGVILSGVHICFMVCFSWEQLSSSLLSWLLSSLSSSPSVIVDDDVDLLLSPRFRQSLAVYIKCLCCHFRQVDMQQGWNVRVTTGGICTCFLLYSHAALLKGKGQQKDFLNVGVTIWLVCLKEEAAKRFPVCFLNASIFPQWVSVNRQAGLRFLGDVTMRCVAKTVEILHF